VCCYVRAGEVGFLDICEEDVEEMWKERFDTSIYLSVLSVGLSVCLFGAK
jgi:hypothetical protein